VMVDGVSSGEPNLHLTRVDMMQVDAPSLMIHRWMMIFLITTGIENATDEGSPGSALSKLKIIKHESNGSMVSNA